MATSESQAQLPPDDNKWYDEEDVLVSDQSLDLPDVGTFNLYKMTPPLKEREGLFVLLLNHLFKPTRSPHLYLNPLVLQVSIYIHCFVCFILT